jgi:hypothetical protein
LRCRREKSTINGTYYGKAAALFIKYNIKVIKLNRKRWVEFVLRIRPLRNAYRILVENPERKGTLRRSRSR